MGLGNYRINWGNEIYFEEVESYLAALETYSKSVGSFVAQEVKSANSRYAAVHAEEARQPYSHDMFDEWGKHLSANGLADILFDSSIIGTVSFVERKLLFLCKELEKEKTIKLDEISGKGIHKYHIYLTKVCNVKADEAAGSWERIFSFGELRNILVHSHANRIIPKNRKELLKMLRDIDGVSLAEEEGGVSLHASNNSIVLELIRASRLVLDNAFVE